MGSEPDITKHKVIKPPYIQPPPLAFLVSYGLAGICVLPVQMGPFGVFLLSCSGDLEVPVSAEIDNFKVHCIPKDAADNG